MFVSWASYQEKECGVVEIKSAREIDAIGAAGRVVADILAAARAAAAPGVTLKELDAAQSSKQSPDQPSASLEEVDRLLASLPRTRVRQLLASARDAFRDGLFWQLKTLPSRALVVSADSFAEADPLRPLDLSADDASRAALQNLRAARKFISKAEAAVEESKRGNG